MPVRIITDSTADLPDALVERLFDFARRSPGAREVAVIGDGDARRG
jgi:hypothetical protein